MSKELQRDICYINSIISKENNDLFSKIFTETNEPLDILFDNLDLAGKKVYTVLSSSDYLYMSHFHNASDIDCFDINPITSRYYYLRKWLIETNNLSIRQIDLDKAIDIVNEKIPKDIIERENIDFWYYALKEMKNNRFYTNMFQDFHNNLLWITPKNQFIYYYYDKMDELKSFLKSNNLSFSNHDISKPPSNSTAKYDYIFLSNILDYHRYNENELLKIKNYLLSILNDKGKVICLQMNNLDTELDFERIIQTELRLFQEDFAYSLIAQDDYGTCQYYQYIKK